jgi:hypothetical protein
MSEGSNYWIGLAERVFGFLITVLGVVLAYYTFTSSDTLNVFTGFFGFLSIVFLIAGLFLLLVKPSE